MPRGHNKGDKTLNSRVPDMSYHYFVTAKEESAAASSIKRRIVVAVLAINAVGATVAYLVGIAAIPRAASGPNGHDLLEAVVLAATLVVTLPCCGVLLRRVLFRAFEGNRPENLARTPATFAAITLTAWSVNALLFGVFDFWPKYLVSGVRTAIWTELVGLMMSAITFLAVERLLRPVFAVVLAGNPGAHSGLVGLRPRIFFDWTAGAAVPLLLLGVMFIGPRSSRSMAAPVWIVVGAGLVGGLVLSRGMARSVADPLARIRAMVAEVGLGNLDVQVDVDDAGEVGLLQEGFNRMVSGLRERQSLTAALGAYVDPGVAKRIIDEGMLLTGEEVVVTVMFLDIREFTAFSETTSPRAVVARLNELWEIVIPLLHAHGGHANKFVGDAVLGVFGAPLHLASHADSAVSAACDIVDAVESRFGSTLRVGIGICSGTVLAGTLGGGGRLEFTVIGDTVNVAARVQDVTKETGDRIMLTETTRKLLGAAKVCLVPRGAVPIRGRVDPVVLYGIAQADNLGWNDPGALVVHDGRSRHP